MVLVAGPNQISWPALRTFLEVSRLSMASEKGIRFDGLSTWRSLTFWFALENEDTR